MAGNTPSPNFEIGQVPVSIYLGEDGKSGGIQESWTDQGLEVVVHLKCAWTDRLNLIRILRGGSWWEKERIKRDDPYTLGKLLDRISPLVEADFDYNWQRFICTGTSQHDALKWSTDLDGDYTGWRGWGYYEEVVIPATFRATTYQIGSLSEDTEGKDASGVPYTTTTSKISGEVFSPPNGMYKWENPINHEVDPNPANIGIMRVRTEYTFTRHFMPGLGPMGLHQNAVGTVNEEPIRVGDKTYPKGTMLVIGFENEPEGDAGSGLTKQTIKWTVVANGPCNGGNKPGTMREWNEFLTKKGDWDKLKDKQGNYVYPYYDIREAIWPDYYP